jgi:fatty acid desaturase
MPTDNESSFWEMPARQAAQLDPDTQGELSEAEDILTVRREQAIGRIRAHKIHRFRVFLVLYFIVNALLIATWVLCAAIGWSQYFNSSLLIVTIGIWGCLVAFVGYRAYQVATYTEQQIQREMQKLP